MPSRITVNSQQLAISDGSSFLVTARDGTIDDKRAQGFFVNDTRLLSYYEITLNRQPLQLLASSAITHRIALYEFTNPELLTVGGIIPPRQMQITVKRDIQGGMHESIKICSFYNKPIIVQLILTIRSDFADIFQVKSKALIARGEIESTWRDKILTTEYSNGIFQRGLEIVPTSSRTPPRYANGRLFFDILLEPHTTWHSDTNFIALIDGETLVPAAPTLEIKAEATEAGEQLVEFLKYSTRIESTNATVRAVYDQALVDMGALRIEVVEGDRSYWLPAAGIPWFLAVFGRDSIIASLQTMSVNPSFARGTLVKLAQLQATEMDDWRDAEPGKILHEIRQGELAQLGEIPHTPYYGTVEATPLWIVTRHEAYSWNGDRDMLQESRAALDKAVAWIEKYGDLDGDGFVEYKSKSSNGLRNQGWKDSGDSIVYPDGSQVEPPIALCEVQGYVFDALNRAADIYDVLNEPEIAASLTKKAMALYTQFNQKFWMESEGFYCLGLDGNKEQIKTIASNAGHLLWANIVPSKHAERMVERMFKPDLWCGWGIRTLSSDNPAYNPLSYQLGSIWPHDCGFIAAGLKQYGYSTEANLIAEGIFAAANYFESGRMPELFAGIARSPETFPVPYLDANVPQAWAAGSIFSLIRTMLGLQANAESGVLRVNPVLPLWLPDIKLNNLRVGEKVVDVQFTRLEDNHTVWEVTRNDGGLMVLR